MAQGSFRGTINKLPLGWLGFLGIKNGGEYPQDASTVLSPTWDMTNLYSYGNAEIANDNQNTSVLGNVSLTTVPNGETWLVLDQSATTGDLTAGQTIEFCTNWTDPAQLVNIETGYMNGSRTTPGRCIALVNRPYFATPGSRMGVTVTQIAAGPINVRLKTRFARFSV